MATVAEVEAMSEEPPMYLQRPSSARSQDVTHMLARTFRHLFTRDAIAPDTVEYLNVSRGGEDSYHEKYVEALQRIQEERDRRMAEAAMLERHIMQAQARAMSADERELNRVSNAHHDFPDLGLPPARSHLRSCIDTALLKRHNLITPDDYAADVVPIVPPPSAPRVPGYARQTTSSHKRMEEVEAKMETPLPLCPAGSFEGHLPSECDSFRSSLQSAKRPPSMQKSKQLWKQQPNAEARAQNRVDLRNLQSKVNYLKNPRHLPVEDEGTRALTQPRSKIAKEVNIKTVGSKGVKSAEGSQIFLASPDVVMFTEYAVGQVYQLTLELKNVTSVLRPIRVVPPKTPYFSLGLGQFPGEDGLVAPGMSCHYTVKFSPDSLGEFDDVIIIQTQTEEPLVVRLFAKRRPPVLTLPEVVDVGDCLVGGRKIAQYAVQNNGGAGRFSIMHGDAWPSHNFKSLAPNNKALIPPFEVHPAVFSLNKGEKVTLEVLFTPRQVTKYIEQMVMVCDNCQVKTFDITGQGQSAGVEVLGIEEGFSDGLPGELRDISSTHLVRFNDLNPYTYLQRSMNIKNKTGVKLKYDWITVKPHISPNREDSGERQTRVEDLDAVFGIDPQNGVLEPYATSQFVVTFAPPEVGKYHDVLHMVLRDIPKMVEDQESLAVEEESMPSAPVSIPSPVPTVEDVTILEIETKGGCDPLSVMIQPYAIYIPGQILVETPVKKPFKMMNSSLTAVVFQWENVSSQEMVLEVEPSIGEIPPQMSMDFEVNFSSSKPGKVAHTLHCVVQHLDEPLMLHVEAETKGPSLQIEESDVNFGLVRLGTTVNTRLTLSNMCQVPTVWNIKEAQSLRDSQDEMLSSDFEFKPSSGQLAPLQKVEVLVNFTPKTIRSLNTIFEVDVEEGNKSAISVTGEVQHPQVCLLFCELVMNDVYLDVPVRHEAILCNQTQLTTSFEWLAPEGSQVELCSISVEPRVGTIAARQQLSININFSAHKEVDLNDIRLPCRVAGMEELLYLALYTNVKGLSVTYKTPKDGAVPSSELMLDYGETKLGESQTRFVHIRNHSAITARFVLSMEIFNTRSPTPPEKVDGFMPNKAQRRALLSKSTLADPDTTEKRAQQVKAKMMLKDGKGASFSIEPCTGDLKPFAEQIIKVTSFSDMWGDYNDMLKCRVMDLPVQQIPVHLKVNGCPLHFQMMAAQPEKQPILRFGTQVAGVSPVTRQMRVNNPSPFDVRVDWQMYNKMADDTKTLDLVVTYGPYFPLKDESGQEVAPQIHAEIPKIVEPPADDTLKLEKMDTDFIPNSPYTTDLSDLTTVSEKSEERSHEIQENKKPKLISVNLLAHEGIKDKKPFSISPEQIIIPARGNANVHVTFTPEADETTPDELDCNGYALGFLSLADKVSRQDGVKRAQAYDVTQLRLEMTANIKLALCSMECSGEEGMRYRSSASDLMQEGQLASESLKVCSVNLRNPTKTVLRFSLVCEDPFKLVEIDPVSHVVTKQTNMSGLETLKPAQNMEVHVAFRTSMELLEYLELFKSVDECEGVELNVHNQERKLEFKHDLLIQFENMTRQRLPLHATLSVPALELSKDVIDFGTCLVGQSRQLEFIVSNTTASASFWAAASERQTPSCDDQTFVLTPNNGLLDAHVTYISNSKTLIQVTFTAKHEEEYEAVYLFHGMLGEEPKRLTLRGQGSYDEKHEAILNI